MSNNFEYLQVLGRGTYGIVYLAKDAEGYVAAKYIFDTEDGVHSPQEIDIVARLDHPNICHGLALRNEKEYFKTNPPVGRNVPISGDALVMVLPLADKLDLTNYLKTTPNLSLNAKIDMFHQICCGVKYLHDNRILHLDLKPDNTLVYEDPDNKVSGLKLKITDFGTCCYTADIKVRKFYTDITTFTFRGPEAFFTNKNGEPRLYSDKCDIWSLGITFFEILNQLSFYTKLEENYVSNYIKTRLYNKEQTSRNMRMFLLEKMVPTTSGKRELIVDLLSNMLEYDSNKRYNINQVLNHPVFKDHNYINGIRLNMSLIKVDPNSINADVYKGIDIIMSYSISLDNLHTETVFLALNIYWRMFSYLRNNNFEHVINMANAAFWLAYKMIESIKLEAVELIDLSYRINTHNYKLESAKLVEYENKIIFTLQGLLYPWNVYNYCYNTEMCIMALDDTINPHKYYNGLHDNPDTFYKNHTFTTSDQNYRYFKDICNNTFWYKYRKEYGTNYIEKLSMLYTS